MFKFGFIGKDQGRSGAVPSVTEGGIAIVS